MARTVRDHRLETRASRLRLPARSEPYWRQISEGRHLGYYRGVRGGKWVARFRPAGRAGGYNKVTLGEADDFNSADHCRVLDYAGAQQAARVWFDKQSAEGGVLRPYTVTECLNDYLTDFTGKSLSSTRARVEALIRPELGHIEITKLTSEQITRWHRGRASSPAQLRTGRFAIIQNVRVAETDEAKRRRKSTANRDLTVLRAALNAGFRSGKIRSDESWRRVRPFPNVEEPKTRYMQPDEARRLVNACRPEIRPLVQAALLTGARYGELTKVQVKEVDLASGTVWWAAPKGGKPRCTYLEEEGCRLFAQNVAGKTGEQLVFTRPDGAGWKPSQQSRPLREASKRAGLFPAVGFHDLRRTYGARLAMSGVPMAVIAEALGHADERITRRHYAHLATSYVSETIRAKVAGMGIVEPSNVVPIARK